ncbi:MAG: asparagine synthase (glutamine-hydrolyzing) [Clostridiales bacterium]|jgi:asparagine synthase (glutamine-hydrolysing)|nr:asparagine synthase (glutamine-hydrolyzing) [Clostridiales bacterium]
MCGFCGFAGKVEMTDKTPEQIILEMAERIRHRGPDSGGVFVDDENRFSCGFRRLSIIDLSDGSQPIFNEDKSIVVFFNGEIYNYKILRTELEQCGHTFYTNTDTEVLAHLYEQYGHEMVHKLRGMFGFVIFDKKTGEIFLVRDPFGIKPVYYADNGGNLLFGSEIKSFLPFPNFKKELNEKAIPHYLTFQYSALEETFFKNVFKLPPGHFIVFANGKITKTRYAVHKFLSPEEKTFEQAADNIEQAVINSIEAHKISDVEVGSFLSSGVDSSFVAARFNGDKTFTVGFDYDKYNEIDYAKRLSEKVGIENFSKMITTKEYWDSIPKVQYHMDEPLADPSAVALYFVSQLASAHVKVALSGEGADEFFGGYNIYKEPISLNILTKLPIFIRKTLGAIGKILPDVKGKSFLIRGSKTVEERFIGNANIFSVKERKKILKSPLDRTTPPTELTKKYYDEVADRDDITKMQYLDINMWLVGDILLKADKMSMAHSLEVRVPYLDREVFAAARTLPTKYRTNKKETKAAFRAAALKSLPPEVASKKKLGFPVPIRVWLREEKYYEKIKKAFLSETSRKYFNEKELIRLLDRHKSGKKDYSRKIWCVYMFLVWHQQFFNAE